MMGIAEAKVLLDDEGYYVLPKDAVSILSTQMAIDRDMLMFSKESAEGMMAATKDHMLRAITTELLKSGALKLTQKADATHHILRLAVAVVVPDVGN
jgi:hypothetical protein